MVQVLVFLLLFAVAVFLFARQARQIRRNILLGRDANLTDHPGQRWRNVLLLALGQKKMFRKPLVAVLHLFVYTGFILINLEILEIVLDGLLGKHRLFVPLLGRLYPWLIGAFEVLAVLVIVGCAAFLLRRNVKKIPRLRSHDLDGWPRSDANTILITEIVLMTLFLTMNTADQVLQTRGLEHYAATGNFLVSGNFTAIFEGLSTGLLVAIERSAWWLHIIGVLAFLNYLPYSKHLHIILAFPNAYYADLNPKGTMENMPSVQHEVQLMMDPSLAAAAPAGDATPPKFGAKDVFDLTWKNLLDAYSCTECGRCSAACPANITGKKLSPRKIMMDTRDRLVAVGKNIHQHGSFQDDGKSLLRDYISEEALRACTTCNACVQECPVSINPLHIISQLRRHLVMEESSAPAEWNGMFSNIENNMAPWKFSPDDRDAWIHG
ncbi:4Fe-4S dicluster domain-containing protein [Chitinophaga costaii]|uniref:4Fe-4S dicluster domain-containing protein n=1 Tax=Chitinophaga costaii TaxID=1335309 RepID=A0A1C4EQP1_9BACT|nr:(Fe-S)-binding protein [Chitinophaga costaii]SCC45823.1 4Fe-4S dicluster domain-containing protein [Chitinophaga costaii]